MNRALGRVSTPPTHRFGVGDIVSWMGPEFSNAPSTKSMRVIRQLPPLGIDPQYRIKSDSETQEHVVLEQALTPGM